MRTPDDIREETQGLSAGDKTIIYALADVCERMDRAASLQAQLSKLMLWVAGAPTYLPKDVKDAVNRKVIGLYSDFVDTAAEMNAAELRERDSK